MEKWDVYDINKNLIKNRYVIRGEEYLKENEYHLVTVSWIYSSKGEFLMQKRAAHKTYPLVYANHGGCALSGETSEESMIRELKEEIGITVKPEELTLLRTFNDHKSIFDEYIVYKDIDIKDIKFDTREVESCSWFTLEELHNLIDDKKCFDYRNNNPDGISSIVVITNFLGN